MNDYIAVIRFERCPSMHSVAAGIEEILARIGGVARVSCDATSAAILVWFNRMAVSVAELVREIEMIGVRVTGIAQRQAADEAGAVGA